MTRDRNPRIPSTMNKSADAIRTPQAHPGPNMLGHIVYTLVVLLNPPYDTVNPHPLGIGRPPDSRSGEQAVITAPSIFTSRRFSAGSKSGGPRPLQARWSVSWPGPGSRARSPLDHSQAGL